MVQFLFFLLVIACLAFGTQWLLAHPGEVAINWFGYDITLHIVVVMALLLILIFFVMLFSVTFWQIFTWPRRRRARRKYRTLEGGLKQLTLGVTALAMGDEDTAQAALEKARLALPDDPLPQLLTAQLLQRQGKHEDARLQFRALMQHETTAALATRRLIEQHVAAHEWLEATKLAEEARQEAPKDRWLVLTLLDLYARNHNSTAMLALSEGWQWQSPLSKEERHRYAALAHYLAAVKQPDAHKKEQSLRHSVGYAPEFLPAIIDFAAVLQAEGETSRARKWLRAAWEKAPSLLLIDPILNTISEESPRAQLRLLRPFTKGNPSVPNLMLMAQQAFDADELERAKELVEQSLALEETRDACSLMAHIEKKLRGVDAANGWLARAVEAPSGETWVCDHCGALHESWHSHCTSCHHFDSLRYARPEARITSVELAPREAP